MSAKIVSAAKQAELLKEQGNLYFKKERLSAAIDAYTEWIGISRVFQAITLCPDVPVYWTNRALCYQRKGDWERVEADCSKALELDKASVKAHYMLGLALLNSQHYAEAIKQLEKALDLGGGANPAAYMVEQIWQELSKARYTQWEVATAARRAKQKEIREMCEVAAKREYDEAVAARAAAETPMEDDDIVESDESEWKAISRLREIYQEKLRTIADIFNKAAESDIPSEIPEHLCCKITMDVFRDPVITPSGVSYERAVLLEHLRKVGKFDPWTRAPLEPEQIVSNLALKEAVQAYMLDHGWAYKPYY
ncbi:E3 ubiquitin-protein ligase CHIP isoform X1 [Selaginella moellendorffii]|uniref:E3 ubiquitin-protein ligase CHIP isoform X1 n=1 Tax=Selaginella moellendorffii TaxID=88036 RepID=UPI000D1C210D|nr:E3 ubiquitin-protein ligase CHIP isoform X1 [Selaginella moellendorffii]|eukprot:XP_024515422.1 E3 ubiquitin-protein ligase CHIP isoform X1 [Selaginella moellendorffii]